MSAEVLTSRDFVVRALAATEIAESCPEPDLKAAFFALAELWLERAEQAAFAAGASARIH